MTSLLPKRIQNLGNTFANSILQALLYVSGYGNGLLHMQQNRSRCLTARSAKSLFNVLV